MSISYHVIQLPLFPTKVCTKCNKEKDLDDFFVAKHGKFGKRADCKDCCARPNRPKRMNSRSSKIGHKICNTCLKEKLYQEFSPDPAQKDGYTGRCKQCRRELYEALPEEEKERLRKQDKESRIPHLEERRARDRKRHNTPEHNAKRRERMALKKATDASFAEAVRLAQVEWRKNNPLYVRESNRRHKVKQNAARSGRVSYKRILERDGWFCYICEQSINPHAEKNSPESLVFDHKIPLHPRKGEPQGSHTEDNIHPSHKICNERKSNRQFENLSAFDCRGIE